MFETRPSNNSSSDKIGVLEGSLCYLIGAIDRVEDQGKGWRREIVGKCKKKGIKIKFLDPTNKISKLKKEIDEEHFKLCELKSTGRFDELSDFVKDIVHDDHRGIDIADFGIVYIDMNCHMCGSYFELQSLLTQHKPYFIIIKQGKKEAPGWLFGILDHNYMFDSVDEVVEELRKINEGVTPLNDKWVLIRKELAEL